MSKRLLRAEIGQQPHALLEKLNGRRVVASVSGGKDSAAMSLHLTERGIEHDRVFMDTGWEHPDTYAYLRGPLTKKLGPIREIRYMKTLPCPCSLGEVSPAWHEGVPCPLCSDAHTVSGMVALILDKAMFPSRVVRFCTQELKIFPLFEYLNALPDDVVNTVGIRRAESKARSQMTEWDWSDGLDAEVWRPLVTWSEDDVIAIHHKHGLRPNPLYLLGASRVGCWPCIYARKEEIRRVAELTPERILTIRVLEAVIFGRQRARDKANGIPERERAPAFFGLRLHGQGTRASTMVAEAVVIMTAGLSFGLLLDTMESILSPERSPHCTHRGASAIVPDGPDAEVVGTVRARIDLIVYDIDKDNALFPVTAGDMLSVERDHTAEPWLHELHSREEEGLARHGWLLITREGRRTFYGDCPLLLDEIFERVSWQIHGTKSLPLPKPNPKQMWFGWPPA